MKKILTIAGSDSGGGAGIQADLKTFHQFGCYGMSALTAVTAQNTLGIHGLQNLSPSMVIAQIEAVVKDLGVDAVKTGMLATLETVEAIGSVLRELEMPNLVVDPVMHTSSGIPLLPDTAHDALIENIFPFAVLVTPNLKEAEALAGIKVENRDDMKVAAQVIHQKGGSNVLIKGGHLQENAVDILFDGENFLEYSVERIESKNSHGTGCTFSAAIAANLALGQNLTKAIAIAKNFISAAIRQGMEFGNGTGPVNHFVEELTPPEH